MESKRLAPKGPVWLDDHRQHTRWVDVRLATVRTTHQERLAMTGDISAGGMRLALLGDEPPMIDRQIEIDVAFEERVVKLRGRPVYSLPRNWGLLVGVRINRQPPDVQDFLFRRYVCSSGAQKDLVEREGPDTQPETAR